MDRRFCAGWVVLLSGALTASACAANSGGETIGRARQAATDGQPDFIPVALSLPQGIRLGQAPLVALEELRVNDGVVVSGNRPMTLTNVGSYTNIGASAEVPSIRVTGTLVLRDWAKVAGDAWAGGPITKAETAHVDGVYLPETPVTANPTDWEIAFLASTTDIALEPYQTRSPLLPGSYRTMSLKSGAQLVLQPGTYHVERLQLEPGSELSLPGPTRIWVRSEIIYRGTVFAHPASFFLGYRPHLLHRVPEHSRSPLLSVWPSRSAARQPCTGAGRRKRSANG